MAASQNVGQTTAFSIEYLDENGNLTPVNPTPDHAPAWSQSNSAVELLTESMDGLTASAKGITAGSDTVKVDLMVNGRSFSATIDMTVAASGPALSSIRIHAAPPV